MRAFTRSGCLIAYVSDSVEPHEPPETDTHVHIFSVSVEDQEREQDRG
jgi:hypothetical protein